MVPGAATHISASGKPARAEVLAAPPTWLVLPPGRAVVAPLVRALALCAAFTPQDRWLGNSQLAQRTNLPASTVSRIAQTLVRLGYLQHDAQGRKYRLTAAVLGLGYAAITQSVVQRHARTHMLAFAEQHKVHVSLAARDRLDLMVLESRRGREVPPAMALPVGMRVGIALSPMGWALLAALPELERHYLLQNVEQRAPRDWPRLRRRVGEGMAQAQDKGYCTAIGEWDPEIAIVATPLVVQGQSPFVLACVGPCARLSRARIERELSPRLLTMARDIQSEIHESGA
ncbi:MAG: IclR family transcriptional regulator [Pseudomonadota bacterium]